MSLFQRVKSVLFGLAMLMTGIIFITSPSDDIYKVIIFIFSIALTIAGIKNIIFYFTMARHMIGGKMILIQGVIILDFAIITGSFSTVPKFYILLYLVSIHAFSGVIEVLRAMEAKNTVEGPWKLKFIHGLINLALAIACFIFIRRPNTSIMIYSMGLIYSAIVRIFSAFQRTSFIIIQ